MNSVNPLSYRKAGILQLMAGATMISFSAVFVKVADVGPTTAGFYRMLFGGLILAAITFVKREALWKGRRALMYAFGCGIFFSLDLGFWHPSIRYIGPGLATLLSNFQVFCLAGFGVLIWKEPLTWKLVIAAPLAVLGLYLIVGVDWSSLGGAYKTGVWLGLSTAIWYSAYLITLRASRSIDNPLDPFANIAVISLFAALVLGVACKGMGESFYIPNPATWAALLGYGVAGQVLGTVLISNGLPKVAASQAGLILLLQPVLSFVWDVLFFARPVKTVEVIGAILALGGIYLGSIRRA